jgi:hypothetical protein
MIPIVRAFAAPVLAILALSVAPMSAVAPAMAQTPSSDTATIAFKGGGVAVGVGVGWGSGVLTWRGQTYKLKTSGLSVVDIGASRYSASGTVTGLKQVSDIAGVYQAAELGATVAGGGAVISMKNDKGVAIKANSTTRGLRFTAAPKGVTIKLDQ